MVSPIFDEAGTVVEAATIARDVSVRKEAEAMTARFVANAAHELRTPLGTLSALTSAMARRWPEMDEAKRQELFSAIGRQGERARLLINNLLELSQLEAGRLKVEPAVVEPAAIVERTVEDVPPPEGKTVLFDPDGARGATAWADPIRLSQVAANLLTNAYKYGGSKVEVSMERPHGGVRVIVSDDGPGLPAELLTSAFEPFTRGHAVGVAQGSGLGLAICRAMLEAFGASIAYEGSGPGARFVVDLPPSP